jgi:hypothetical protein
VHFCVFDTSTLVIRFLIHAEPFNLCDKVIPRILVDVRFESLQPWSAIFLKIQSLH